MTVKCEKIGEVRKNDLEKVVVSVKEFNGKIFLDARIWWRQVAADTKWNPSKKGICITLESAKDLTGLFAAAASYCEKS